MTRINRASVNNNPSSDFVTNVVNSSANLNLLKTQSDADVNQTIQLDYLGYKAPCIVIEDVQGGNVLEVIYSTKDWNDYLAGMPKVDFAITVDNFPVDTLVSLPVTTDLTDGDYLFLIEKLSSGDIKVINTTVLSGTASIDATYTGSGVYKIEAKQDNIRLFENGTAVDEINIWVYE